MNPARAVLERSIVLLAGPGGVGKTSVAAATALYAALRGRRVLVVTVDPARRLADAMGLATLGNQPAPIDLAGLAPFGPERPGSLAAMMLDTRSAADELVARCAPSSEVGRRVLDNRIYRTMSESLAGSQEYVAMGKLFELVHRPDYDLVVVDTAPTRYALDFFEAPTRLVDLLDAGVVARFMKPVHLFQRVGLGALRKGSGLVLEALERVIGLRILSEISEFLTTVEELFGGLRHRAERMHAILKDRGRTAFAVVTGPSPAAAREAGQLAERVSELGFPLTFVVMNRLHPPFSLAGEADMGLQRFLSDPSARGAAASRIEAAGHPGGALLVKELLDALDGARSMAGADRLRLRALARQLGGRVPVVPVPFLEGEICDLASLHGLAGLLYGAGGGPQATPQ